MSLFQNTTQSLVLALAFAAPLSASPVPTTRTIYYSPCSETLEPEEEYLLFAYSDDKLILIHHNAAFNCASNPPTLEISFESNTATIIESAPLPKERKPDGSTSTTVALCDCFYTIIYEISNIQNGKFTFKSGSSALGQGKHPVSFDLSKPIAGSLSIQKFHFPHPKPH
jgi:hypothetical protein